MESETANNHTTAPFTPEQVHHLNEFQAARVMHPFTCPNDGEPDHGPNHEANLVATINGWICPYCSYTQDWAHDFMANGEAVKNYRLMSDRIINKRSFMTNHVNLVTTENTL